MAALEDGDLTTLRVLTKRPDLPARDIVNYWSHSSAQDMASQLLSPIPGPIADITRAELLDIVTRIMAGAGPEAETQYLLALFAANVPHPTLSDLIFWPDAAWLITIGRTVADGPSPEEVVERALKG